MGQFAPAHGCRVRGGGAGQVIRGLAAANGSAPDEAVEEQRGVADDARRPGLFVLTALQGQPVVHVTFSVEARLEGGGAKMESKHRGSMSELLVLHKGCKLCSFFAVDSESCKKYNYKSEDWTQLRMRCFISLSLLFRCS